MRTAPRLLVTVLGSLVVAVTATASANDLPHRDDFSMNSISGGDFRDYVSNAVMEEDGWAKSMRTLGILHNHMHELMSELARHAAEEREDDHVPEFDIRISGGEWSEYRERLEDAEDESTWRAVVQIAEIMHDRVHHAMYSAVLYDSETRGRNLNLDDYIGDRAPYEQADTIPSRDGLDMDYASSDVFRSLVWDYSFEGERLNAAMQKATVFDTLLEDVMTQWAQYAAATMDDEACQPPAFGARMDGEFWAEYARRVEDCGNGYWRDLVRVTELMHDRVHHMLYTIMLNDAELHEREDAIERMLN